MTPTPRDDILAIVIMMTLIAPWGVFMNSFFRRLDGFQVFFGLFFFVILTAYVVLSPGWGFMDDWQCGQIAQAFWRGEQSLAYLIQGDIPGGRFRPVYYLWIVGVYWLKNPLILYLLILAIGCGLLLVWGRIIHRLFPQGFSASFNHYLYPLVFFLFLPFWNMFMYISVQEKFLFIFGTLSLYFLARGYQQGLLRDFIWALVLAVLATMGKETGVAFFAAYGAFAFLDLLIFKTNSKRSLALLGVCLALGGGYVLFMKSVLGGYTAGYKTNLDVHALVNALRSSPSAIKAALVLSGLAVICGIVDFYRGVKDVHPLFLVCPLWVMFYTALLLPWGFPHYLLAPLAPFVMMTAYYFLYRVFLWRKGFGIWIQAGIVICVLAVLSSEIVPRISKMADKWNIVEELMALNTRAPGKVFYPPYYAETAMALEKFSSVKINYTGTITADDLDRGKNYLVINDEASPVSLQNVALNEELYRNGTWVIRAVEKNHGTREQFRVIVPKNAVQKLKGFITSH